VVVVECPCEQVGVTDRHLEFLRIDELRQSPCGGCWFLFIARRWNTCLRFLRLDKVQKRLCGNAGVAVIVIDH